MILLETKLHARPNGPLYSALIDHGAGVRWFQSDRELTESEWFAKAAAELAPPAEEPEPGDGGEEPYDAELESLLDEINGA